MNFWYLSAFIAALIYSIPVLLIRTGIDRRIGTRRVGERRVCVQTVSLERRCESNDRRHGSRRG